MSQFKNAQAILIPSEYNPKIWLYSDSKTIALHNYNQNFDGKAIGHHLIIISDDEIKENDKVYDKYRNVILECPDKENETFYKLSRHRYKKIISTTDPSVTESIEMIGTYTTYLFNLPEPTQEFIKDFIVSYNEVVFSTNSTHNTSVVITDVLVEYEIKSNAALGHDEWVYLHHIEGKRYIPIKIEANINQDTYELGKEDILEDFEIETNLIINPKDNTITIKIPKELDSNKEHIIEVTRIAKLAYNKALSSVGFAEVEFGTWFDNWIKTII